MHDEVSAISPAEPVTRTEKKETPSARPGAPVSPAPTPKPPTAHPHKGRLLDVLA